MKRLIGKCGTCGGRVTVPDYFHSVRPPVPACESCGAQVDDTAHLPVLPMRPKPPAMSSLLREVATPNGLIITGEPWRNL